MTIDIETILKQFEPFGVNLGWQRVQRLLADLDNPEAKVPMIHVAATNGKGSVCAYLSAILTAAGYRVGRYTSPHLIDWTECIYLNEKPIILWVLNQDQIETWSFQISFRGNPGVVSQI